MTDSLGRTRHGLLHPPRADSESRSAIQVLSVVRVLALVTIMAVVVAVLA